MTDLVLLFVAGFFAWLAAVCLVLLLIGAATDTPTPTPTERDRVHAERRKWTH